ncbi:MAG: hypothetical protein KKE72_15625 [Gammaproteobacteria bacterium]|nr:hypothetical protein [Gammaproteobacteria bacterium]MBU2206131.1 hypothetical protein [Gammaproteobacteria bacterium]
MIIIVPDITALTLADVAKFTSEYNPTAEFRAKWLDSYFENAMALHADIKDTYLKGLKSHFTPLELLFGINYDYALSPYHTRPEQSLMFYRWILAEIKKLN